METKVVFQIQQEVLERAQDYAKEKNQSLSDIIESFLKNLTLEKDNNSKDTELTPIVKSLKGSFKIPADFDYNKEMRIRLEEKHL